jgi:uncharacterized protein YecE (DUF72 family)
VETHVGTSGWTYPDWAGRFYPRGVSGAKRLAYYATRFDAVEIDATFYRFPTPAMIDAWNRRLPRGFNVAVKGHRRITHAARLRDCEEIVCDFLASLAGLRALRVVLWQLHPAIERDLELLSRFLALLPRGRRLAHAFEFRHASWWHEDVARVLRARGAAFVAVSHPRLPPDVIPTGRVLYLRFHGLGRRLYDYDYSRAELRAWAERLRPHLAGRSLYAFFNNDGWANAPRNAETFRALLGAAPSPRQSASRSPSARRMRATWEPSQ